MTNFKSKQREKKMPHKFKDWTTTFQELKPGDLFLDLDCDEHELEGFTIWVKMEFFDMADCVFCSYGTEGSFNIRRDRKVLNLTEASKERRQFWKVREYAQELEGAEND
tara:strand:+ start:128 stop:454 length:327 start_codon:yes stop_codon:yes gene_type:complete